MVSSAVVSGAVVDGAPVVADLSLGTECGRAGADRAAPDAAGACASARGVGFAVVAGALSTGWVFVPGKLKFWSSRGPTASVAGVVVLVVAGAGCDAF